MPLAGVYANGTLVVLLLGSASRAKAPQRNRDRNTFEPKQERICLAPKAQHSAPAWGSAPGKMYVPKCSAESAIHSRASSIDYCHHAALSRAFSAGSQI